eukprot:COSAG05_NODE_1707_length_4242_cov_9.508086_7_plen_59_part_00
MRALLDYFQRQPYNVISIYVLLGLTPNIHTYSALQQFVCIHSLYMYNMCGFVYLRSVQ